MSKVLGVKRRADDSGTKSSKKLKSTTGPSKTAKPTKKVFKEESEDDFEEEDDFDIDEEDRDHSDGHSSDNGVSLRQGQHKSEYKTGKSNDEHKSYAQNGKAESKDGFLKDGTSSREAHAEQKKLAQQRKASKPNADSVYRAKKLWEKLRIKSNVPKEERKKLVEELFSVITGKVKDFVFKHDSVRVIQCALKYATPEQKKEIARELRGSYRELAESKYAKFLVAKLVMIGDEVRDWIVEEFYGHVKRLVRHPEAGWIVDDIYRGIATKDQKARLLREWYGPEFVVMKSEGSMTGDLSIILGQNPEKRGPIMAHLKEMTNQLVQKKTTGFTMLHDALLQYFLNCKTGSPEQTEVLEMLKDDEEGDLFKNLAFTKSGSRLVCLALAYGSAKDRRTILKFFKTHIKALAGDAHGCHVLLAAYEVIDDTVMSAKAIFLELLNKDLDGEAKNQELLAQATHLVARVPLLWQMSSVPPRWLITEAETIMLNEIREIRKETSKKDPEKRRTELVESSSQPLLDLIASQAANLAQSSFGTQFITEVLFGSIGQKDAALEAVANLVENDTTPLGDAHVGRMLKSLVQGGPFDKSSKSIVLVDPPLNFDSLLYNKITADDESKILEWASGANSFVVLAMLESPNFEHKAKLSTYLQKRSASINSQNAGGRIILETIGASASKSASKQGKIKKKTHKAV